MSALKHQLMKYLLALFILLSLLQLEVFAQKVATSTMKISATIVCGTTLDSIDAMNLNLKRDTESRRVFKFIAPKNIETSVLTENSVIARNEFGDKLKLVASSIHESKNGTHSVDLSTKVENPNQAILRGSYTANIKTSINFL